MTNKEILKYIQLYTNCADFTLKRIAVLLDTERPDAQIVEKILIVDRYIRNKHKPPLTLGVWSTAYFTKNDTTYAEINMKCRKIEICKLRNVYCKAAYAEGYSISEIGRYLKRNHTTILHNVHQIKTK